MQYFGTVAGNLSNFARLSLRHFGAGFALLVSLHEFSFSPFCRSFVIWRFSLPLLAITTYSRDFRPCSHIRFATYSVLLQRCAVALKSLLNTRHYSLVPFAGNFRGLVFSLQTGAEIDLNHSAGFFVADILNMAGTSDFQHINILRAFYTPFLKLSITLSLLCLNVKISVIPLSFFTCGGFAIFLTPFCRETFSSYIFTLLFRIISFASRTAYTLKIFCLRTAKQQQTHIKNFGQAGTCATRHKRKAFTLNHGRHSWLFAGILYQRGTWPDCSMQGTVFCFSVQESFCFMSLGLFHTLYERKASRNIKHDRACYCKEQGYFSLIRSFTLRISRNASHHNKAITCNRCILQSKHIRPC